LALTANDIVTVLAFTAFSVSNTYTQAEANARFVQNSGNFSAGKNKVINGDFGIWQRGTSFTNPVSDTGFTADRWYPVWNGTGATRTLSRQTFTPGAAPVAGYEGQFFLRYDVSVAGSSNSYNYLTTSIEDVRTLAGQTVTVSFWAKASAATSIQTVQIDQNFGSGGSAINYNALSSAGSFSLTTSWQRFSFTATMASVTGKTIGTGSYLRLFIALPAFSSTFAIDVWGVQLEAGSIATAFQTATGNPQAELALCQRYFSKSYDQANAPGVSTGVGAECRMSANRTDQYALDFSASFPVIMRGSPTVTLYSTFGTSGRVRDNGAGVDRAAAAIIVSESRLQVGLNSGVTTTANAGHSWHWTASAEL
jgi:hypothetical protein